MTSNILIGNIDMETVGFLLALSYLVIVTILVAETGYRLAKKIFKK